MYVCMYQLFGYIYIYVYIDQLCMYKYNGMYKKMQTTISVCCTYVYIHISNCNNNISLTPHFTSSFLSFFALLHLVLGPGKVNAS